MKALVTRVIADQPIGPMEPLELIEIDVSTDATLEATYGLEVPVLFIDGKKAVKYRIAEGDLRRILAGRSPALLR
jgi:hypothetical protein